MECEPFGTGAARVIHRRGGKALLDLPLDDIRTAFTEAGMLLFRGFESDPELMLTFAGRLSTRFNRDRLRPPVPGSNGHVQMVTEGTGYVEPHSEQANSPFRPDALWFCCERPAAAGGETLVWDGVPLWNRLEAATRTLFRTRKLRFFQHYPKHRWELFLGDGATIDDVERELSGRPGVSYFINEDQSIYLEYVCSAVVRTRYGDREAFANSLLSERRNTLGELMAFDDGSPVLDSTIEEIETTMADLTQAIAWEPGDLAFIDNSRYLHGRNPYSDTSRKIFSSLSFLDF